MTNLKYECQCDDCSECQGCFHEPCARCFQAEVYIAARDPNFQERAEALRPPEEPTEIDWAPTPWGDLNDTKITLH